MSSEPSERARAWVNEHEDSEFVNAESPLCIDMMIAFDAGYSEGEKKGALEEARANRPTTVCLCGSTRFFETFQEASLRETVAGKIVLSIGCNLRSDHQLWADPAEREEIKRRLDDLHFLKIEMADEVLILNVNGYIGASTRRELRYARKLGKPVRWWEPERALYSELGSDHERSS